MQARSLALRSHRRVLARRPAGVQHAEQRPPPDAAPSSCRRSSSRAASCRRSWSAAPAVRSARGWPRSTAPARRRHQRPMHQPSDPRAAASGQATPRPRSAQQHSSLRVRRGEADRDPARAPPATSRRRPRRHRARTNDDDHEQHGQRLGHDEPVVDPQVRVERGDPPAAIAAAQPPRRRPISMIPTTVAMPTTVITARCHGSGSSTQLTAAARSA